MTAEGSGAERAPRLPPLLDEVDRVVLAQLALDGRASLRSLARGVGLSVGTVGARLDRMMTSGAVRVVGLVDPAALGQNLIALVVVDSDGSADTWDDDKVKWAMAFRYDPIRDTVILPAMNTMTVDPTIGKDDPPATISKVGFDCTIPWGTQWTRTDFDTSGPYVLGDPPDDVTPMDDDALTQAMRAFIAEAPRSWKEILENFRGQGYRTVYRAFGNLRPELGRVMEASYYPYTFSSDGDFVGDAEPAPPTATHHLHPPA